MVIGGNDVLVCANRGSVGGELVKAFRAGNISGNYRFIDEIKRRPTTVDFASHLERGLEGRKFRDDSPSYLRTIDTQLQDEFNWNNSSWGDFRYK